MIFSSTRPSSISFLTYFSSAWTARAMLAVALGLSGCSLKSSDIARSVYRRDARHASQQSLPPPEGSLKNAPQRTQFLNSYMVMDVSRSLSRAAPRRTILRVREFERPTALDSLRVELVSSYGRSLLPFGEETLPSPLREHRPDVGGDAFSVRIPVFAGEKRVLRGAAPVFMPGDEPSSELSPGLAVGNRSGVRSRPLFRASLLRGSARTPCVRVPDNPS